MGNLISSPNAGQSGSSVGLTSRPRLLITGLVGFLALVMVFAVVRSTGDVSGASIGTISTPTDLKVELSPNGIEPTVRVRDDFNGLGSSDLDGRVTEFDGGDGYTGGSGPTFNTVAGGSSATNTWHGKSGGVQRDLGSNYSAALVPWLTRKSKIQAEITGTINDTLDGGMIINTNATGTSGVAVRINCSGQNNNCQAQLVNVTGAATRSACSSPITINQGKRPNSISISDFINDQGAAGDDVTVTVTTVKGSGGTSPATLTCEPTSPATGSYSGLISFSASANAVYEDMVLSFA